MANVTKTIGRLPVPRGDWKQNTGYYLYNLVQHLGSTFMSLSDDNATEPAALDDEGNLIVGESWQLWADGSGVTEVKESVARLVPGFMGKEESGDDESFSNGLLEYPHYTRPEVLEGREVPEVLRGGDHGAVARWRRQQSLATTLRVRPDLLDSAPLVAEDARHLATLPRTRAGRNLSFCLVHYPVLLGRKNSGVYTGPYYSWTITIGGKSIPINNFAFNFAIIFYQQPASNFERSIKKGIENC